MRGRRTLPRKAAGYQPARKPKLRAPVVTAPPPVPVPPAIQAAEFNFGDAEEDGLRMLAALEAMDSLEPDFCGDLVAEASVTIIARAEAAVQPAEEPEELPSGSLRARLDDLGDAPDIDADEYAAYLADVEEAVVEIVEVTPAPLQVSAAPGALLLSSRPRAAHRFFKALGGQADD
jgi:hypothetical protein